MIGLGFYNAHNTTLDINGPFLRFTDEPAAATANDGGSVTISGTAVAEFKHSPTIPGERVTNTGEIKYQWYIDGVAAEDATDRISGSQTNEITISNLVSPTDNAKSVFLRATYEGSAYQSEAGAITAGIARSTGNGVNEPVDTSAVIVTVNPTISITTHPFNATVAQTLDATFTVVAATTDNSTLSYQWNQDGVALTDGDNISGSNTSTLTISSSDKGTSNITVTVSHPTAGNSPITSDAAVFTVVSSREIISYLEHDDGGSYFGGDDHNLFDGPFTVTANPTNPQRLVSFYSPEKDITIKMTMGGGAGKDLNGIKGGEGGTSSFLITLEKNCEYVLKLGAASAPTGGANGGGGAVFLYKQARLIVVIGGGGGAGYGPLVANNVGGRGGGIGFGGQNGTGRAAGQGGAAIAAGALPAIGVDNVGALGGTASACTIGSRWFRDRYSPCQGYGLSKYLNYNGIEMPDSPVIQRGWKSGTAHRNNGGDGTGPKDYYIYSNPITRRGSAGFNQKPSCIGIANGWYTRTGRPISETGGDGFFDARATEILWDGVLITGSINEDGYVISGNHAYTFGEYRSPSIYGWKYNNECGYSGPEGSGDGDFGNGFDIVRYDVTIRAGSGNGGGGSGADGGDAGTAYGSGGGGGSGYSSGEVTVLDSDLGGNPSENSYAKFEYYTP